MLEPTFLPDHGWIAAHIPHQGRMCLLERVLAWEAQQISCLATRHRAADHPLREDGQLGISAAIEYAAQAMAVHGVLLAAGDAPLAPLAPLGIGYLTSVRGVRLHATRLDDIAADLHVQATRLSGDATLILYQFSVGAAGRCLAEGRATVMLDANASFITS